MGFGPGNSLGFAPTPDEDFGFNGDRSSNKGAQPAKGGAVAARPAAGEVQSAPPRPAAPQPLLPEAAMTMEARIPDLLPRPPLPAAQPDDDDEEFGAATADHTVIADASMLGFDLPSPLPPRPAVAVPSAPSAAVSSQQAAISAASKRPESLPRPRLARRAGTMTELPTTARDMSKDLSTLDFFVERGYRDSAVALLDELEKRHPDSHQLRMYRMRIERLQRS